MEEILIFANGKKFTNWFSVKADWMLLWILIEQGHYWFN